MDLSTIHIPLDEGPMEPQSVLETIRGGGELLLKLGICHR
jgi:hypothetical protein